MNLKFDHIIAPPVTTELDFTPVNGLRMLQREFGAEGFDPLFSVLLRKHDYDPARAAKDIRDKDLCSCFLSSKMQLADYNIDADFHRYELFGSEIRLILKTLCEFQFG